MKAMIKSIFLKTSFLALLSFFAPIVIGILAYPLVFDSPLVSGSPLVSFFSFDRGLSNSDLEMLKGLESPDMEDVFEPSAPDSLASVVSDSRHDPVPGKLFLVSLLVRFEALPPEGERRRIIAKYNWGQDPYAGWAMALRRLNTSMRPEVYWKGEEGKGGWFTFETFDVKPGSWYTLSLVSESGSFLGLYVQESAASGDTAEFLLPTISTDSDRVKFFGAYDVSEVTSPTADARIYYGAKGVGKGAFIGDVAHMVIASSEDIPPSVPEFMDLLAGGPHKIKTSLSTRDITLWVENSRFRAS